MRGIFTTIKVINSYPFFLETHALRLTAYIFRHPGKPKAHPGSLSSLNKTERFWTSQNDEVSFLTKKFIKNNHITNAALRVEILENGKITFKVRELPPNGTFVNSVTLKPLTLLPTIKQLDRTIYEHAQVFAEKKDADRAIFISNNIFLESTISNIISLDKNGEMITPLLITQGYKGVMRETLLERKYIKEKEIPLDTNGPLVLINSLRIEGVTHLDGRELDHPRMLMEKIDKIISSSC